jgi:hypothetical protein
MGQEKDQTSRVWRLAFYVFLGVCFALAVFFNQFGIMHDKPLVVKMLGLIAFCGTMGLLMDYAYTIKHSWFWLIPGLTALEFLGDAVLKFDVLFAFYIYQVSALLWPVYGILFIIRGGRLLGTDRSLGIKFIILGILASAVVGWEFTTLFPQQYDYSHWGWRSLYLGVFAWLLVIDYTTDFSKRPEMKIERQIMRMSLLLIAVWYFVRFIFK